MQAKTEKDEEHTYGLLRLRLLWAPRSLHFCVHFKTKLPLLPLQLLVSSPSRDLASDVQHPAHQEGALGAAPKALTPPFMLTSPK